MAEREPHWYLITIDECPVCGCSRETRERMHTPRPEHFGERHKFELHYDYCQER